MQLEASSHDRLRQRVLQRYARTLLAAPDAVIDFLLGQFIIATRHLPQSRRVIIAERLRDAADSIERNPD
jgi:hypothetical protein